jgi:hypothetical protein
MALSKQPRRRAADPKREEAPVGPIARVATAPLKPGVSDNLKADYETRARARRGSLEVRLPNGARADAASRPPQAICTANAQALSVRCSWWTRRRHARAPSPCGRAPRRWTARSSSRTTRRPCRSSLVTLPRCPTSRAGRSPRACSRRVVTTSRHMCRIRKPLCEIICYFSTETQHHRDERARAHRTHTHAPHRTHTQPRNNFSHANRAHARHGHAHMCHWCAAAACGASHAPKAHPRRNARLLTAVGVCVASCVAHMLCPHAWMATSVHAYSEHSQRTFSAADDTLTVALKLKRQPRSGTSPMQPHWHMIEYLDGMVQPPVVGGLQ